jgi:hypothetical protein
MSTSRYTVRRVGWFQPPHGDPYTRRLPVAEPVAAFDTFDAAEMYRRELEAAARDGENPFRFGGASVFFQSSLDGPRLHDWLMDAGIEPPASELRHSDWRDWWNAFAHTWSADQLAHAWAAFDKVRFFDVAEDVPGAALHLIQEVRYVDRESWFPVDTFTGTISARDGYPRTPVGEADDEGGVPVRVYRSARRVKAACEQLNRDPYRRPEYLAQFGWLQTTRRGGDARPRRALLFEAVRVPGEVPPHAGVAYLVQRRAFGELGYVSHGPNYRDTGSRVPVRLFADRAAANAHRDELFAAAVGVMNPFQAYAPGMTGLGEDGFLAAVAALAPPLPWPTTFQLAQWREWWDLCQDEATNDQRAAAWALFDDRPLFEVLRVEVGDE